MNRANLLPWREEQLRQQGYHWLLRLSGGLLALFLAVAISRQQLVVSSQRLNLHQMQQQQEIDVVEQRLQQLQQLNSLAATATTQRQTREQATFRSKQWVSFWENLPQWLPPSVWLTSVTRQGKALLFMGESDSLRPLIDVVDTLHRQLFFTTAVISELTRSRAGGYRFTLTTQLGPVLSSQWGEEGA